MKLLCYDLFIELHVLGKIPNAKASIEIGFCSIPGHRVGNEFPSEYELTAMAI